MRYVGEADTVADCLATSGLIWLKLSVFVGVGVCVIHEFQQDVMRCAEIMGKRKVDVTWFVLPIQALNG